MILLQNCVTQIWKDKLMSNENEQKQNIEKENETIKELIYVTIIEFNKESKEWN